MIGCEPFRRSPRVPGMGAAGGWCALWMVASALIAAPAAWAQPVNNACASATPALPDAVTVGDAQGATSDGSSACSLAGSKDVYHTFVTARRGVHTFSLCTGTTWDTVISLHTGCPADSTTLISCDDEGCGLPGAGVPSVLRAYLPAATPYIVRIAGYNSAAVLGPYTLTISTPPEPTGACCFATNCGVLTASGCATISGTYKGDFTACESPAGMPTATVGAGTPANIPDNNPMGVSRTITLPTTGAFVVADVRVSLELTHAWVGDLVIRLTHGATTVTLIDRLGLNGANAPFGFDLDLTGAYVFTDAANDTLWDAAAVAPGSVTALAPGSYRAVNSAGFATSLRQAFAGQSSAGAWTITLVDANPSDAGTLNAWSLTLDASVGGACAPAQSGACCTGNVQGGLGTTCTMTTAAACSVASGSFRGVGVACFIGTGNAVACCKANFDQVNGVTIDDLFLFLNAWFTGHPSADINQMDGVTIDDLFLYFNAWFTGC